MAITNKCLVEGTQLTASAVTQYTAPGLTKTVIKKVTVCNSTGSAATLTLNLVVSGGTAGVTNVVTSAKSIAAGATYEVYEAENHVLNAGDFISALSGTAAALTLKVSGIEIV
jgi:hypothetical protein